MSLPVRRGLDQGYASRWQTITHAINDTRRTVRLCAILLVTSLAPIPPVVITVLLHHYF
jgi:hypothetical protein